LSWNPVASPSLSGYMVYYGPAAGNYPSKIDVGNTTTRTVTSLVEGATYHFAVTAYDGSHAESGFSNDVAASVPYSTPVAQFTASTTSGVAPLALNFLNTSTGTITSYGWNFGDGTTSTAASPSHVYAAAGVYTVSLTVTGPGGTNTQTRNSYVTVSVSASPAPVAQFTGSPLSGTSPLTVAFTNSSTGSITSYAWTFGDGTTSTAASPNHVYAAAGVYTVKLTVTGPGGSNTQTRSNYVAVAAPPGSSASTNVARASTGAVASASSTYNASYSVAAVNNGDRTGAGWGAGGGWRDATAGVFPDYVQIVFNGWKTIDHVIVYTLQDNFASPVEPTDLLTFSNYGVTAFTVQGWNGSNWVNLGTVNGNNLVKRTVNFSAFTTDRIRVNVNNALNSSSRIVEIEAFGVPAATMPNNVAAAALGAVASASSTYSTGYPVAAVNNGDRTGAKWRAGGGWRDATVGVFPDYVQIVFNGQKTIDHVIVYALQDNFARPVEPTNILTFSQYGITAFTVQGWSGSNWVTLGTVTGNNLVKRTVNFSAFTTDRIRVNVNNALYSYSRIVEIEAWGN